MIPNHVGIIVDGNGRWATKRGLKRSEGHKAGADNLDDLCKYILDKGVNYLSLYVFSTENFKRSEEEVNYLMDLFVKIFKTKFNKLAKLGIKIIFSGRRTNLEQKVLKAMDDMTNKTKDNKNGVLNLCLNYGSHAEIVDAIKKIEDIDSITEDNFSKYLYNDLPNIDLLIRTGGEYRLSNFMLWQASYAELYFTDILFPDFKEKEFDLALEEYNRRDRRYGGINYEKKTN